MFKKWVDWVVEEDLRFAITFCGNLPDQGYLRIRSGIILMYY